jgi:hypothetical protein
MSFSLLSWQVAIIDQARVKIIPVEQPRIPGDLPNDAVAAEQERIALRPE